MKKSLTISKKNKEN
jgi:hypothetical protein